MSFKACWECGDESEETLRAVLSLEEGSHSTATDFENAHRVVESFCTRDFHIALTFSHDFRRIHVAVSIPVDVRSRSFPLPSKPTRFHFGETTSGSHWQRARDAYFEPSQSNPEHEFLLYTNLDVDYEVEGMMFVIQKADGSWIKTDTGDDFSVMPVWRTAPRFLEVPLPSPFNGRVVSGMMSLYRGNAFWLSPRMEGNAFHDVMHETWFLIARLQDESGCRAECFAACAFVASVKSGIRTSLYNAGRYAGIRIESSHSRCFCITELSMLKIAAVSFNDNLYTAVRNAAKEICKWSNVSTREFKMESPLWKRVFRTSALLNRLGLCTWDAFAHEVSEELVIDTFKWLESGGVRAGYIIIDDGWQDGGDKGPLFKNPSPDSDVDKLYSFGANSKFRGSLKGVAEETKCNIFAWTTILGYWRGVHGRNLGLDSFVSDPAIPIGLVRNGVEDMTYWKRYPEILSAEGTNLEEFFSRYFERLQNQGVIGVKVDAQSYLEILQPALHTQRGSLLSMFRAAMKDAAEQHFKEEAVLNCMCCGPEAIFSSQSTASVANICWRSSDDHAIPGVEENDDMISWHIIRNCMTSLYIGEIFGVTDWDMFRVCDERLHLQAVARVISGGPIYISDKRPVDEWSSNGDVFTLLQQLCTRDGRLLRCLDSGRPIEHCVFQDARTSKQLFKIFNRNQVSFVMALFHLIAGNAQHDHIDACSISSTFTPAEIPGLCNRRHAEWRDCSSFISLVRFEDETRAFFHTTPSSGISVTLRRMKAVLVNVTPVFKIGSTDGFAVIGSAEMLNCGAVMQSVAVLSREETDGVAMSEVDVTLLDHGRMWVWVAERVELTCVTFADGSNGTEETCLERIGELMLTVVQVPRGISGKVRFVLSEKKADK